MPAPLRLLLPLSLLSPGCSAPWDPPATCADYDACGTTSPDGSEGTPPTTSASEGVHTVTGASNGDEDGSTSPNTGSSGGTDTTGQPAEPPVILDYELGPDPITSNGPIAVSVTAEHASGVRLDTGLGDVVELTPQVEPGVFVGEFAVLTSLLNGPHSALLIPWKSVVDGEAVPAPYEISLPTAGSEKLWETGDLIGPGQVVAMATLPTGEPVELGNFSPGGEQRCYLRVRDKAGLWAPADIVDVLPDTPCVAIDLKIDAEGALFVLVQQQSDEGLRWRLMKIPAWGQNVQHMGLGAKDELAVALAHHPSGMVGVCGTAPTGQVDKVDAMARIFRPGMAALPWVLDYRPDEKPVYSFAEQTRDCVFVGDTLALVGEARGLHGLEGTPRDRLFILRLDVASKSYAWTVALPGDKQQSGAQAVDVDSEGHLVIGGYTCDDDCKPIGDLRIYDEKNSLLHQVSLGNFPTKQFTVQDLVWSSAGYVVVATGGMQGNESAFTVRAFAPSEQEAALWTFTRSDLKVLHFALALAIGNYGEVYAGGFGANGYPAVAFIAG